MAKHHRALAPEQELEQLEELLGQPVEPGTGGHVEGSMEMATSLGDDLDLGAITEQRPELELVVGWEAGSPAHDLAFGIYRASASTAKNTAPAARKVAAPGAPKVAAPPAPADKPTRFWN